MSIEYNNNKKKIEPMEGGKAKNGRDKEST